MLPGVLLHVIEAPRPIDFARHLAVRRQRRRQKVRDAIVFSLKALSRSNGRSALVLLTAGWAWALFTAVRKLTP
jgi:hypothetical protein